MHGEYSRVQIPGAPPIKGNETARGGRLIRNEDIEGFKSLVLHQKVPLAPSWKTRGVSNLGETNGWAKTKYLPIAQPGRVPDLGSGDSQFESEWADQIELP